MNSVTTVGGQILGALVLLLPSVLCAAEMDMSADTSGEVPEGYHSMPDGSLMANNPSSANVPPGYHMMPDGTLMRNSGGGHHNHGKGGWMFDYVYTRMNMDGLQDGTKELSNDDVFAFQDAPGGSYMMTATGMTMDMHMFMVMYGLTDKMMLMGMLHYMSNSMDMEDVSGCKSTMDSSGLADTIVGVMYQTSPRIMLTGNISLPTGSIDEEGTMSMQMDMSVPAGSACNSVKRKLPYGMQLGSGTIDLMPKVSFKDGAGNWGWGIDAEYIFRTGENDNGWTLGNRLNLDFLGSYAVTPWITGTGRLSYTNWEAISGEDDEILQTMMMNHGGVMMTMGSSPMNDPDNYGGSRTDFLIGMDGHLPGGHKLGFEVGVPVQQDLNGPQMKTDLVFNLSYQYMM